jgi:hypothetical protein
MLHPLIHLQERRFVAVIDVVVEVWSALKLRLMTTGGIVDRWLHWTQEHSAASAAAAAAGADKQV